MHSTETNPHKEKGSERTSARLCHYVGLSCFEFSFCFVSYVMVGYGCVLLSICLTPSSTTGFKNVSNRSHVFCAMPALAMLALARAERLERGGGRPQQVVADEDGRLSHHRIGEPGKRPCGVGVQGAYSRPNELNVHR